MQFDQKDRINILLHLLKERYYASHQMRERSLRFTIWVLGYAIAFVWIIFNKYYLSLSQKWFLTALVIVFGVIAFLFLRGIERGFKSNRAVMIKVEKALGCYKTGLYVESDTLYPGTYKKLDDSLFHHFKSVYVLMVPLAMLIIVLIWLCPTQHQEKEPEPLLEKQRTEQLVMNRS